MSETQALIDLSRELGELQLILTNIQINRDAYKEYTTYLRKLLAHEIKEGMVYSFDEFVKESE